MCVYLLTFFLNVFHKQAWPLLYSHLCHRYLVFTPPSSLWSSIWFLAQVAMCPQVRFNIHIISLVKHYKHHSSIISYYKFLHYLIHAFWTQDQVSVIMFFHCYWDARSFHRYLCCGESDDWVCSGAAGSHTSGNELNLVWSDWLWSSEDWSGLSCSTTLRNYYG